MTLTQLVLSYQEGCDESAMELLDRYDPTIRLFTNVLYFGRYIKKPLVEEFIKLLIPYNSENYIQMVKNTLRVIATKYSTALDYEDIVQEIKYSILQTAKKYDYTKVEREFEYFFHIYFKYVLKRNTIDSLDSPISITFNEEKFSDDLDLESTINYRQDDTFASDKAFVEKGTEIKCLQHLTKAERILLKRYFLDGLTLHELADEKYDITYSALSRKIKKIKETIKEE